MLQECKLSVTSQPSSGRPQEADLRYDEVAGTENFIGLLNALHKLPRCLHQTLATLSAKIREE
ncbi:hypothetical protein E2C01_089400 [Portunus trituberculatus]|uniref:Uncharacterized protein n=1 Tax=Portunus trituberculatus TaxID=210409 RepID=A0A5B7JMA2_PORTR|nr:hypothetical protein [Portunus trituberculatus]